MSRLRVACVLGSVLMALGCAQAPETMPAPIVESGSVAVATVPAYDSILREHLHHVLAPVGLAGGSGFFRSHTVLVDRAHEAEARAALETSMREMPDVMRAAPDSLFGTVYVGIQGARTTIEVGRRFSEVDDDPPSPEMETILAILRGLDARGEIAPFRFVDRIELIERKYQGKDGKPAVGYEFTVDLRLEADVDVAERSRNGLIFGAPPQISWRGGRDAWHGDAATVAENRSRYR